MKISKAQEMLASLWIIHAIDFLLPAFCFCSQLEPFIWVIDLIISLLR